MVLTNTLQQRNRDDIVAAPATQTLNPMFRENAESPVTSDNKTL